MNCLPVIEMEMRSACRRTWTFRLRLLFALAACATCMVVLMLPRLAPAEQGRIMLVLLSFLGLVFCLAAGGFLTADCVSAEKREGTLGLLFLTPLTGMDIVLGKLVCRGLQTFYGICAVFPVFFLPLLTGGVTWSEVCRVLLALGLALLLSASVGMFASVLGTESRKTMMAALASVALIAAGPMLYAMVRRMFAPVLSSWFGVEQFSPVFTLMSAFEFSYRGSANGPASFWSSLLCLSILSLGLVVMSGFLLGRVFQTAERSRSSPKPRRVPRVQSDAIEGNPYEWVMLKDQDFALGLLSQVAVLFFAAMLITALATPHWREGFISAFFTALAIHLVGKLRYAVEATRQINIDRQSGALELLLVSPTPESDLVKGHLQAMRKISRRPLVLLIGLNVVLELSALCFPQKLHIHKDDLMVFSTLFVGGMALAVTDFRALSWLGLLNGLKAASHVKAVLLTFTLVMVPPWVGLGLAVAMVSSGRARAATMTAAFFVWIVLSLIYDWVLIRHCRYRMKKGVRRMVSESVWTPSTSTPLQVQT